MKGTNVTKKPEPTENPEPIGKPSDVVQSMLIAIEQRSDGMWRCEVVSGCVDSSSLPKSEFKPRRLFLREYHRMLEQVRGVIFKGAIANTRS